MDVCDTSRRTTVTESRGFGQSNSLPTAGSVGAGMGRRNPRQFQIPSRNLPPTRLGLLGPSGLLGAAQRSAATNPTILKQGRQNLWFANPGGSNSMPSRTHSSVQRTRSLPVHTSPQTMLMFQQPDGAQRSWDSDPQRYVGFQFPLISAEVRSLTTFVDVELCDFLGVVQGICGNEPSSPTSRSRALTSRPSILI
ncbi:Protein Smaug like protein 1 [Chelonia mydas]|uniref:Protein Smaug like protein 1 n=1 Tax=Chelonia mydas TaxID=8469 RepID=M7BBZ9_CHEMY|nr:Protein Smaug like protein 1 [Chelonia mydas]